MRRCLWIYCDINNGHNRIGSLHIPCSTGGKSSISSGLCVLTLASPLLSLLPVTYKDVFFCGLQFLTGPEVVSESLELAEISTTHFGVPRLYSHCNLIFVADLPLYAQVLVDHRLVLRPRSVSKWNRNCKNLAYLVLTPAFGQIRPPVSPQPSSFLFPFEETGPARWWHFPCRHVSFPFIHEVIGTKLPLELRLV